MPGWFAAGDRARRSLLSGAQGLREYERARRLPPRPARRAARARASIYVIPVIEKARAHRPAHGHDGRAAAGRDHQGQRLGEGERGALLPRRRPEPGGRRGRELPLRHSQLAQTTLRSVCGQAELDELLAEREKINAQLQEIIDQQTEPWGIKVVQVEIKHIDLPEEMQRAMARQAEAERERRAKVIAAEGEFQAAQRLAEAAAIMAQRADGAAAALPADARRDRDREQLDDDLPGADRPAPAVPRARGEAADLSGCGSATSTTRCPPELIAQEPAPERDGGAAARPRAATRLAQHATSRDLPALLRAGDLLVAQRHARHPGARARPAAERRAARAAASCGRVGDDGDWEVLVRGAPRAGERVHFRRRERASGSAPLGDGRWRVRLDAASRVLAWLERAARCRCRPTSGGPTGRRPIDRERYQTIFARAPGAVAAPTAGLHFTPALLDALAARGVEIARSSRCTSGRRRSCRCASDDLDEHAHAPESATSCPARRRGRDRARARARRPRGRGRHDRRARARVGGRGAASSRAGAGEAGALHPPGAPLPGRRRARSRTSICRARRCSCWSRRSPAASACSPPTRRPSRAATASTATATRC